MSVKFVNIELMNLFRVLTILICSLLLSRVQAGRNDTLIIDSVTFHSEFEREQFTLFDQGVPSELALLVSTDSLGTRSDMARIEARLKGLYDELDSRNIQKRSIEKKIKIIFKVVHEKFLVKYSEQCSFLDLFDNGSYNCVTASACYAIVFQQYDIEVAIQELPTHVYLIADPGGENITIESTDPLGDPKTISEKEKRK